jgi:hypothetical protein
MQFELARGSDEPALRRLLRATPLPGEISVTLEREPCIEHANAVEGERTQILVARPTGDEAVVAMAARTVLTCFVNGRATQVGYLGQLRILPRYQGQPALLKRGYAALHALHADGVAPFYLTTIVADNRPARRVLEAGLKGFPIYRYCGDFLTLLLSTGHRRRCNAPGITVSSAGARDVDDISGCLRRNGQRYQFSPVWNTSDLRSSERARGLRPDDFLVARRGTEVVGCVALWDQRKFKQVVVHGYSAKLKLARPLWNAFAPLLGSPRLPRPGSPLAFAYLSHLGVDNDDREVFEGLAVSALHEAARRGLEYLTLGLAERNPLTAVALARFSPRIYRSRAYLVYWPDGAGPAHAVDSRPMHLEAAIL